MTTDKPDINMIRNTLDEHTTATLKEVTKVLEALVIGLDNMPHECRTSSQVLDYLDGLIQSYGSVSPPPSTISYLNNMVCRIRDHLHEQVRLSSN